MTNKYNSTKPFLRWAGSKKQLLPQIVPYWVASQCNRYVEPFAGSACLFFHINPPNAILGDINTNLIETYKQIKNNLDDVLKCLHQFERNKEKYYELRALDPSVLHPSYRAARFIYLNRFCFNGLYRTNLKGRFNVPYGGSRTGGIPSKESFISCSKLLKKALLVPGDFEEVLKCVQPGDFVYMDPPFRVQSKRVFNEYDRSQFSKDDFIRLRGWMDRLTCLGVNFLVSYALSDEANLLSSGYQKKVVSVRRNIAGFAKNRRKAKEVLISNGVALKSSSASLNPFKHLSDLRS